MPNLISLVHARTAAYRRARDVVAGSVKKAIDPVPSAPEISPLFPEPWSSPKAAERWLAKNPPEAHRVIIRVWGLLTIAVQRSWSKALVRHGADPRLALAAVRGVAACRGAVDEPT